MIPADLSLLQTRLSYLFKNKDLLRHAVTHKSYLNETKQKGRKDNERLEFLGDSVLDLIVGHELMERFPKANEGDLSKMKAKIVTEETLAEVAGRLHLGTFLYLGKGEEMTQGMKKPSLLADAMEALIAAVYLDGGIEAARQLVLKQFDAPLRGLSQGEVLLDYKTSLQEYSQKVFKSLPVYRTIHETGPDHEKKFEVEVVVAEKPCGMGLGKNKKTAEQKAAKEALRSLMGDGKKGLTSRPLRS